MRKHIIFKGVEVSYTVRGKGPCLVLLHGYLESGEIWDSFSQLLTQKYRVIVPDLPGHGKSGTWGDMHSMEDLADAVKAVAEAEEPGKFFLVGHSMGGYVVMACAERFPEKLWGYSLFHSTCFADNEEKKANRDREISLVLCGKKRQIVLVNIPKAFSSDNVENMPGEIERARRIAMESPDKGVIALLQGMKARPDRSEVLKNPSLPLLLVGGMKDNYIPVEVFEKLSVLAPHARVLRLEKSGHMGFIEEPEKVLHALDQLMATLT